MAGKISFECPECSAKLSVSDPSKLGKRIKCPKCGEAFTPEVPDDDDEVDILEGLDEDDEEVEEPVSKRKSSGGGARGGGKKVTKKGSSSGSGSNNMMIIGGIVGLIVLIGGGLGLATFLGNREPPPLVLPPQAPDTGAVANAGPAPATTPPASPAEPAKPVVAPPPVAKTTAPPQLTPAEKTLGLRWMPFDTEMIIHAKPSEIWKAPLLAAYLNHPSVMEGLEPLKKIAGIGPADVESVTIGMANLSDGLAVGFSFGASGAPPTQMPTPENQRFVLVLKTKTDVDWKKISTEYPGITSKEAGGKTYYEAPPVPGMQGGSGWWSPDPKTVVLASTKELLATIERGETVVPRKEFAAINHTHQLVIATVIPNLESNPKFAALESVPAFVQFRDQVKPYALQLASIGFSVKGGFDVQAVVASGTDDGVKNLKAEIETGLKTARAMFDSYKETAPPLIGELGEMLLKNLKTDDKNRIISLSTNIPNTAQDKLEQLPPLVMMMAMTGGLAGGPGGTPNSNPAFMEIKLPGETDPVAPESSSGLFEGMTMTAKSAWSVLPVIAADGKVSPTIDILIDVTGSDLEKICAASGISPKTMNLEGSATLKQTNPLGRDKTPTEPGYQEFDATDELTLNHPPKTLRVKLTVDVPKDEAKSISVLEGSFKFLTANGSEEITIDNVPRTAKRPVTVANLKAAEVKLRISHSSVHPATLSISCGKDSFIGSVKGTPGETMSVSSVDKEQSIQEVVSNNQNGEFPENFSISFKLHSDVKENLVRFRFENVPLPDPAAKPVKTVTPDSIPKPQTDTDDSDRKEMTTPRPRRLRSKGLLTD